MYGKCSSEETKDCSSSGRLLSKVVKLTVIDRVSRYVTTDVSSIVGLAKSNRASSYESTLTTRVVMSRHVFFFVCGLRNNTSFR